MLVLALVAGCGSNPEPPTFVAPPTTPPGPTATPSATPAAPTTRPPAPTTAPPRTKPPAAKAADYRFPVGVKKASFGKTHSGYPASDIFADCGAPVLAATDGVVLEVDRVDRWRKATDDPAERGGISVAVLGDDGVRYYGSHLSAVASGIDGGVRVRAGQRLGSVGTTGRANGVCHLHFGISPPCRNEADWWIRRGVIWPARYLTAWRSGRDLSPVREVTNWKRANGCPAQP
jgi:murein DD-endopeptidase MepM/ murein hydrolase activator NlpD